MHSGLQCVDDFEKIADASLATIEHDSGVNLNGSDLPPALRKAIRRELVKGMIDARNEALEYTRAAMLALASHFVVD